MAAVNLARKWIQTNKEIVKLINVRNRLLVKLKRIERYLKMAQEKKILTQLGKLLLATSIPAQCGIKEDDDLFEDNLEKAHLLVGVLNRCSNMIPDKFSEKDLAKFKESGKSLMFSKELRFASEDKED